MTDTATLERTFQGVKFSFMGLRFPESAALHTIITELGGVVTDDKDDANYIVLAGHAVGNPALVQEENKNNIGLQVIHVSELFDRSLSPVRDMVTACRAGSLPWSKLTISYAVATEVNKISFAGANFK